MILYDLGEGLLTIGESGELIGGIAERWEVSDDGEMFTFHLRSNLKWSDGSELDAQDVVRSFQRLVEPGTNSPSAHNARQIKNAKEVITGTLSPDTLGVSAPNARTVEIVLEHPTSYFLQLLAHPSLQPRHDSWGLEAGMRLPITNGAYKVSEVVIGTSIRLTKNEHYWNSSNVAINEVLYHVVDQDVEPIRFVAEELDITDNVSEAYFDKFKDQDPEVLEVAPMLGIYYLGFNLKSEQFQDNLEFRHALSLAIDREELVEKILGRGEIPAYRFVPPGIDGYPNFDEEQDWTQVDREVAAKRLMMEAGIGSHGPIEVELSYNTGGGHERIAAAVASMWRQVLGVNSQLRGEEFKVFIQNVQHGVDTELFRLSWTGDYNDPYTFLQLFESSSSSNFTGYESAYFDSLIHRANAASNPSERQELLVQAEELVLDYAPAIPLYFYVSKHLVNPRVHGWKSNILDVHKSQYLSIQESR